MCGIAGFFNPKADYLQSPDRWTSILQSMNRAQKHRGPDGDGTFLSGRCGLSHVRLAIIDLFTGDQPMSRQEDGRTCTITYNGEIYNMHPLKKQLQEEGCQFHTTSDTEVILAGFMRHGTDWFEHLNGVFAFAIWDETAQKLTLVRDHAGVKPLYYAFYGETFLFSSELKGILNYPGMEAEIDREGLCEIFALGPAHTPGNGVFRNIHELLPAHYMQLSPEGQQSLPYWKLKSEPHTESFEETVEHTRYLITDAVKMQMLSDIPICTFLSGGVDSSLVTSICAATLREQGKQLSTFSFDFEGNDKYFRSNSFQVSRDRPYVDQMVFCCQTKHQYLECNNTQMADYLYRAVDARDLPCMADVESSMLYFCEQVSHFNHVTLTGECADEIFGGYPWFHRPDMLNADGFPWSNDMNARSVLLSEEMLQLLPMKEYAHNAFETSKRQAPLLAGESEEESKRRQITWLNMQWFMMTLLHRMDRSSMQSGLEARVPFADYRIIQYLWNVPWNMKCPDGLVKGLLRKAGEHYLPDSILYRKKSPYPKTYHPEYEELLKQRLRDVIHYPASPLMQLVDVKKVEAFLSTPSDYGKPWYGQLMAGPQMIAYALQVNYWLQKYHIRIVL